MQHQPRHSLAEWNMISLYHGLFALVKRGPNSTANAHCSPISFFGLFAVLVLFARLPVVRSTVKLRFQLLHGGQALPVQPALDEGFRPIPPYLIISEGPTLMAPRSKARI